MSPTSIGGGRCRITTVASTSPPATDELGPTLVASGLFSPTPSCLTDAGSPTGGSRSAIVFARATDLKYRPYTLALLAPRRTVHEYRGARMPRLQRFARSGKF